MVRASSSMMYVYNSWSSHTKLRIDKQLGRIVSIVFVFQMVVHGCEISSTVEREKEIYCHHMLPLFPTSRNARMAHCALVGYEWEHLSGWFVFSRSKRMRVCRWHKVQQRLRSSMVKISRLFNSRGITSRFSSCEGNPFQSFPQPSSSRSGVSAKQPSSELEHPSVCRGHATRAMFKCQMERLQQVWGFLTFQMSGMQAIFSNWDALVVLDFRLNCYLSHSDRL